MSLTRPGLSPRSALRIVPPEAVPVTLLAVAVWVAALAALPAYRVAGAPGVLAGAAGGAALISLVGSRGLRLPAPVAYTASLVGLVLLLLAAIGADPSGVAGALVRGPGRVLTETLPLSGGVLTITALVVLTWVGSAAAAEIVIRGGVPGSSGWSRQAARPGTGRGAPALAMPVLLYLICFAVASAAPRHDRAGAPVLLVLLALAAASMVPAPAAPAAPAGTATGTPQGAAAARMSGPDDPEPPSRRRLVLTGLALTAVVAAGLAAVAPSVPGLAGSPAPVHRRPPLAVPAIVDPVGVMAELRDGHPHRPPVPELTARLSAPSTGYLALADLAAYDGAEWRFSATFLPTGGRVPGPPAGTQAVADQTVTQQVTISGPVPVPLLPALDRPVSVAGSRVAADPVTGMLLPQSAGGGTHYTVTSRAPAVTLTGLPAADGIDVTLAPAAAEGIPPNTSTDLATVLRFLAQLTGTRPAPTLAFLQQALAVLHRDEKRIQAAGAAANPGSTPPGPGTTTSVPGPAATVGGTSLSEVINAVTVNRAATPEQFATLYAMVARYLGVPARVVTGFRLAGSSAGSPLAAGTYRVTSRQAWAWVEIPVAGVGWVVADPTPDATTSAAAPPPEAVQAAPTTLPPRSANAVPRNRITGGHALAPRARFKVSRHRSIPVWLLALIALAAALVLMGLIGPGQAALRRAWRRRNRRSADPAERAVGAWLEFLDGLERAGMPAPPGATNAEVAADVAHHFGSELVEPAAAIAVIADRAVFAPSEPLEADSAERAWQLQDSLHRLIHRQLDRRGRLWALLSVGHAPRRATDPAARTPGGTGHSRIFRRPTDPGDTPARGGAARSRPLRLRSDPEPPAPAGNDR